MIIVISLLCLSPEDVEKSDDIEISRQFKETVIRPILKVETPTNAQNWSSPRFDTSSVGRRRSSCHCSLFDSSSGSFPEGRVSWSDQWNRVLPAVLLLRAAAARQQRAQLLGQKGLVATFFIYTMFKIWFLTNSVSIFIVCHSSRCHERNVSHHLLHPWRFCICLLLSDCTASPTSFCSRWAVQEKMRRSILCASLTHFNMITVFNMWRLHQNLIINIMADVLTTWSPRGTDRSLIHASFHCIHLLKVACLFLIIFLVQVSQQLVRVWQSF